MSAVARGWAPKRSAAAPATCGVEAEVPLNLRPARSVEAVETTVGPARSGLVRPSRVGPWEL